MWWDAVIDVLWPTGGTGSVERSLEKKLAADTIPVEFRLSGSFKRRLNQSGWLADEVIAAGMLRQGKAASLPAMVTGLALIELARPRRSKSLPREFALALTADRVIAFAISPWKEGDGPDPVIRIKHDERGCWPRRSVRLIGQTHDGVWKGATIELAGAERIPVTWQGDHSTNELVDLLSR